MRNRSCGINCGVDVVVCGVRVYLLALSATTAYARAPEDRAAE
jgi:hypothetical protein